MKRPAFIEGVAVALAASVAGSIFYTALTPFITEGQVARLLISGGGLAYVLYLLVRAQAQVGRVTTVAAWLVTAAVLWLAAPPVSLYALAHLAAVWIIRSLYFYTSALSALADLGLNALALAAAVWAFAHSSSLFLAVWCFFLIQALFVAIPETPRAKNAGHQGRTNIDDHFQRAHRVAEAALRRLSSTH